MIKNKYSLLILAATTLLLPSCAHHKDVRPGSEGIHSVVISSETKEAGSREAIDQATDYCDSIGKHVAFVDEKANYSGSMSESDYNKAKTVAKVGHAIGGAGYVFGGEKEKNAGAIVAIGSGIADSALGNGYKVEMKFKCQ